MFMVKDEYINIKKLLNVRIKTYKILGFFTAIGIIFISNLVLSISRIMQNDMDGVTPYNMQDYSYIFIFSLILAYFILLLLYRYTNNYLSVFPQTNNSRFISSQLFNCLIAVFVGLSTLIIYLLNYVIFKIISYYMDSVYLVYEFDVGFLFMGFITFIVYIFLIISIFGLIGVVLRKWKYYAVIVFTLVISFVILNIWEVIENSPNVLAFLLKEPDPVRFIIKGVGLCSIITILSLFINYHTVYYKSQKKISKGKLVLFCIIVSVTSMIIFIKLLNDSYIKTSIYSSEITEIDEKYIGEYEEIHIDVSHLKKGSSIKVKGENVFFPFDNDYSVNEYSVNSIAVDYTEELNNLQGDKLIIKYIIPEYYVNDCAMSKYSKPEISVSLVEDTLYINYTYQDAHVIFLPVWSLARQFECYQNKNLLNNSMTYGSGHMSGIIQIFVE